MLSLKWKLRCVGLETWAEEEEPLTEQEWSERCEEDVADAAENILKKASEELSLYGIPATRSFLEWGGPLASTFGGAGPGLLRFGGCRGR